MLTPLTGLIAGALHVVTGPDHITAIAPLAVDQPRKAAAVGFTWGLGHGLGVVGLGLLGLSARDWFDLNRWSDGAEWLVGLMLIGIGLWALLQSYRLIMHSHTHAHTHTEHHHVHAHASLNGHESSHQTKPHTHAIFAIGMLHGAAGSGHLFGVLPALALPTSSALLYLVAYLLAAIASMSAFAGLLGVALRQFGTGSIRWVGVCAGAGAIAVGLYWLLG